MQQTDHSVQIVVWLSIAIGVIGLLRGSNPIVPLAKARESHIPLNFTDLRISEIMVAPLKSASFTDDDHEFIELQNQGTTVLDMGGVSFSDGIVLTISPGTQLGPGAFLVIAANPAAFEARYSVPPSNITGYTGKLSNNGERVALINPVGTEILGLTYYTDAPHLQLANGGGYSLVPVDPTTNPVTADDWRISSETNGSPGQADAPPASITSPPIKVNEVLAHTDLPQIDFIELYNPTDAVADIGGWYITDSLNNPTRFRIPLGTQIAATGYRVFTQDQLGFAFFAEGDSAYLLAADAAGTLTGYSHGFDFGVTPNGFSLGRCTTPDGNGGLVEQFPLQESISEGAQNGFPLIGPAVISEIMYAPTSGDEYIELANFSSADTPLYDPEFPENLWKIDGIGTFTFTANSVIPANGTLLVTSIDPALFRSRYNIPANVPIQGPYSGQLDNAGERISLQEPDDPNTDGTLPYIDFDVIDYEVAAPWPAVVGLNQSLERIVLSDFGGSAANWAASGAGGTPGAPRSIAGPVQQGTNSTYLPLIAAERQPVVGSCFRALARR